MNPFKNLEPADPLRYFALICSIPHPSGHEKQLAEKLLELAREHHFPCRMDHAGNIRIDRPASPGLEDAPHIILQGHLDMVPKAAEGKIFDFTTQPVEIIVEDGCIHANGTTLGADNGAGVAAALAMLFDPELKTGAVSGLFTVGEEVGLLGANAVDPEMLKGDWLFNLDSGEFHRFCIGCAGGARLSFEIPVVRTAAPSGNQYSVKLGGLQGGHSGTKIHNKCGNALILLAEFLQKIPCRSLISLNGGSADNAIPADAEAVIVSELTAEGLRVMAQEFVKKSAVKFHATEKYGITITSANLDSEILDPDFAEQFTALIASVPNEVFDMDQTLGIVNTSSNFASVHTEADRIIIHTSQRSLNDESRIAATEKIRNHFAPLNGNTVISGEYPGWPANPDSDPVKTVSQVYRDLYGKDPGIYAIHAGLETGAFAKKNPDLKIISFGPTEEDIHTEREKMKLEEYQEFYHLLRCIVEQTSCRKG